MASTFYVLKKPLMLIIPCLLMSNTKIWKLGNQFQIPARWLLKGSMSRQRSV